MSIIPENSASEVKLELATSKYEMQCSIALLDEADRLIESRLNLHKGAH